jgi:hypothetical protein
MKRAIKQSKKKKKKELDLGKRKIITLIAVFILAIFLVCSYFHFEKKMYKGFNYEFSGDCGHFVVWMSSIAHGQNFSIYNITYQINPLVYYTGPYTIKKSLEKLGMKSRFYNNFSIEEIKKKLDENKSVIIMMNTNGSSVVDSGSTHYLYIFDYNQTGLYFYDSYYWTDRNHRESLFEEKYYRPYFMDYFEIEEKWENVMDKTDYIGKLENTVGIFHLAMVIDDEGKDNFNTKTKIALYLQYLSEKIIEFIGRIVVFISPRI